MSEPPSRRTGRRPLLVAFLRRLLLALLGAFVLVTVLSLVVNLLTRPPRTVPATSGHDVRVAGARVHYERWGERGSPVVLVHGAFESTAAWSATAPLLARRHRVYAVDLAGYGYSSYTGRYTLADQAALVDGFVRALHLRRPVLVGHSLGAAVVGAVALRHPEDLGGVVFADGDALPFADGGRPGFVGVVLRLPYVVSAYRLVTRSTGLMLRALRAQCGSVCRAATPALARAWARPLRQGAAEAALRDTASRPLLALTPAQVRAIAVPRAVVWGAEDSTSGGSLAGARRNLHDPPTVVIPRAGHLSMVADPAAFATAVDRLVAGMEPHPGQSLTPSWSEGLMDHEYVRDYPEGPRKPQRGQAWESGASGAGWWLQEGGTSAPVSSSCSASAAVGWTRPAAWWTGA